MAEGLVNSRGHILVTGAAGFIGSYLVAALLDRGHRVVAVDNLAQGQVRRIERLIGDSAVFIEADVRDPTLPGRLPGDLSHVVHLAETKIPRYGDVLGTLENNVDAVVSMLELARGSGARFVLGSTDEVYGKNPEVPLHEESGLVVGRPGIGRWSFATSKMVAEHYAFAYREKYGVPVTVLRYSNGYGPHQDIDWHGGPQAVFITAAIRGNAIPVHGDGLQTRTFTFVSDLVAGTMLAMESPYTDGEILNIAGRDTVKIINLAYLIWRLVGPPRKPLIEFVPYTDFAGSYEDVRQRPTDISKAFNLIGYEPRVSIVTGLRETIQWQQAHLGIDPSLASNP